MTRPEKLRDPEHGSWFRRGGISDGFYRRTASGRYVPAPDFFGWPRDGLWLVEVHPSAVTSRWMGDLPEPATFQWAAMERQRDACAAAIDALVRREPDRSVWPSINDMLTAVFEVLQKGETEGGGP